MGGTNTPDERIRPVIQEFCSVCFNNDTSSENVLVMCNGCYKAYHQKCYHQLIPDDIIKSGLNKTNAIENGKEFYCSPNCRNLRGKGKMECELPRKNLPFMFNKGLTQNKKKSYYQSFSTTENKTTDHSSLHSPNDHVLLSNSPSTSLTDSSEILKTNQVDISNTINNNNSLEEQQEQQQTKTINSIHNNKVTSSNLPSSTTSSHTSPSTTKISKKKNNLSYLNDQHHHTSNNNYHLSTSSSSASQHHTSHYQHQHYHHQHYAEEVGRIIPYTTNHPTIVSLDHQTIPVPSWEIHTINYEIEKEKVEDMKNKEKNNNLENKENENRNIQNIIIDSTAQKVIENKISEEMIKNNNPSNKRKYSLLESFREKVNIL